MESIEHTKLKPQGTSFLIKSDAKPNYRKYVKKYFPKNPYQTFHAGENKEKRRLMKYTNLEKRIFDPLFAANQRMAKLRDHIKRPTKVMQFHSFKSCLNFRHILDH